MTSNIRASLDFARAWNDADDAATLAKTLRVQLPSVLVRAKRLRKEGVALKPLPEEARTGRSVRAVPASPVAPAREPLICSVQTTISHSDFVACAAGAARPSSARIRELILRGLNVEALERGDLTALDAELRRVAAQDTHDCDDPDCQRCRHIDALIGMVEQLDGKKTDAAPRNTLLDGSTLLEDPLGLNTPSGDA